ncbi:MAG TPA: hypothetical protein VK456_12050 [Xanthobacteraceae bacterium]|nr:hypothetical protein [Xanthobacteraceae bacterium]
MAVVGSAWGFCPKAVAQNVVAPGNSQVSPADDARLAEETRRRKDQLSEQGYNVFEFPGTTDEWTAFALGVNESRDEGAISLWLETAQDEFAMELRGPHGEGVASVQGWRADLHVERALASGRYVGVLHALGKAHVHGVIGIKRPGSGEVCKIDGHWRMDYREPVPPHYWWPYLLFTPASPADGAPAPPRADRLLVAPNDTPFATDDVGVLWASAICDLGGERSMLALGDKLGTPVLVPLFPRQELKAAASNLQLQALTRASLKEKQPWFARVDLQLIAMIEDARKELAEHQPVQSQVLMAGFSSAGSFTNRFTMLHPKRVLAAAAGSPSWPIAPVAADRGERLRYPVGIADVKQLTGHAVDLAALRRVHFLFFLGKADNNDAAELNDKGTAKFLDSFSDADAKLINRKFGKTLVARWCPAQRLYDRAGMQARFRLYDGKHEITPAMFGDMVDTFRMALGAPVTPHAGEPPRCPVDRAAP